MAVRDRALKLYPARGQSSKSSKRYFMSKLQDGSYVFAAVCRFVHFKLEN